MRRLEMAHGDSARFAFDVFTADELGNPTPVDISDPGVAFVFTAKRRQVDTGSVIQVSRAGGDIVVTDGPGGQFEVRLSPSDTDDVDPPDTLWWDVQMTISGEITTLDWGVLAIRRDIS